VVLVGFAFGLQKCSCKFFEVILSIQTKLCEFMSLSAEGLAEIPPVSFASLFQHFVQTWANGSCTNSAKKKTPAHCRRSHPPNFHQGLPKKLETPFLV